MKKFAAAVIMVVKDMLAQKPDDYCCLALLLPSIIDVDR